jgi:hypothetical protein
MLQCRASLFALVVLMLLHGCSRQPPNAPNAFIGPAAATPATSSAAPPDALDLWNSVPSTSVDFASLELARQRLEQERSMADHMRQTAPTYPPNYPTSGQRAGHLMRSFFGEIAEAKLRALRDGLVRVWPHNSVPPTAKPSESGVDDEARAVVVSGRFSPDLCLLFLVTERREPAAHAALCAIWTEQYGADAKSESETYIKSIKK